MATKKNIRNEVRIAPATPVKPDARRVVPKKPATMERRVVAPVAKAQPVAATPATPAKPAEKRVAPVVPVAKKAARPKVVGKSKAAIGRLFHTVDLLDEVGPDVTELIGDVIRPHFASLEEEGVTLSLAILNRAIARKVSGTGTALDGESFAIAEGELVMLSEHNTGGVTVYNTATSEPVEMVMDAKARKSLDYTIVPTDLTEFDALIGRLAKTLAALGMPMKAADGSSI